MKHTKLLLAIAAAAILCGCENKSADSNKMEIVPSVSGNIITFKAVHGSAVHSSIWYLNGDIMYKEVWDSDAAKTDSVITDYGNSHYAVNIDSVIVHGVSGRSYTATLRYLDENYANDGKEYYTSSTVTLE